MNTFSETTCPNGNKLCMIIPVMDLMKNWDFRNCDQAGGLMVSKLASRAEDCVFHR